MGYAYMASGLVPGTEVNGAVTSGTAAAIKGTNTASGSVYGVAGEVASTAGCAVFGSATATSGTTYGVYAISTSIAGRGVFGTASATTGQAVGVEGQTNSTAGRGVYGLASATTGTNYGVYGRTQSPSGYAGYFQGNARVTGDLTIDGSLIGPTFGDITGVNAGTGLDGGGTSGDVTLNVEVPLALTANAMATAVVGGENTATSGTAYGVRGTTASTAGRAVLGDATATAGFAYGVFGLSASAQGRAVYGEATATTGYAFGIHGVSQSTAGRGVFGQALATSGVTYGVYGQTSSPSGYAGYFEGNTRVTGDLTVDGAFSATGIGDITAVTAGTGLNGGGTSGDVTLNVAIPLSIAGSVTNSPYAVMKARNTGTTMDVAGIWGESACPGGGGVFGYGTATTGTTYGVLGQSLSTAGRGVWGYASAASGTTYGVYGEAVSASGYAGYFNGDARVTGDLTVNGTLTAPGVGDITAVNAGTGLSGGGSSGNVTLQVQVPLDLTVNSMSNAAIEGNNTGTPGQAWGLRGTSTYGTGVEGVGAINGVSGLSYSTAGKGVYGSATATSGETHGVHGRITSEQDFASAVWGEAAATSGIAYGVEGTTQSSEGIGVFGYVSATTGGSYGIYGGTLSPSGYAGYFQGDVHVSGNLSKSSGSFLIDHPLDPENKLLRHNFVESPEHLVVYRGSARLDIQGEAVIEMPAYFTSLAKEEEATIHLTAEGRPFQTGYAWNADRASFIAYGEPNREVSWMVMAERDDPVIRRLARRVEEDKGLDNTLCPQGRLLDPVAYGYPETMGRDYEMVERERRRAEESRSGIHREAREFDIR